MGDIEEINQRCNNFIRDFEELTYKHGIDVYLCEDTLLFSDKLTSRISTIFWDGSYQAQSGDSKVPFDAEYCFRVTTGN